MSTLPIGIIDIGSNSVRFVVYDPPYIGQVPYFNEKVQCGLGRDLGKTGHLHLEGRESAHKVLKGFRALADAMGLKTLYAVGTAALRDASDGQDFVDQVSRETDIDIRIIDGEEEARLCALGVLQNFDGAKGVMGDLGGGSLELALIGDDQVHDVLSLPLGVLRILSEDDPRGFIRSQLKTVPEGMTGHADFYTVGGTWRAMTHIYNKSKDLPYERLMGKTTDAADMAACARQIAEASPEALMTEFNVEDRRAGLMPTAALLLAEVLETLDSKRVITSTSGLRDGVLFEVLHQKAAA